MPHIAFERLPWSFDGTTDVVNAAKRCVSLHKQHTALIERLASLRLVDGSPIIRPMWYSAPDDVKTYRIVDQYMLGDQFIVAPVLVKGQRQRSVYIPAAAWYMG